jgi:aryl-alcohol dehydrogenase-like predicted oxidoreductase
MKYRLLGKTGLKVSEIGFGCGDVGGLMVRAPLEERVAAVTHAVDLGINYFDTAQAYGKGQSEINLGEVLALTRTRVTVATKVRLGPDDFKDISGSISRSLEASLKRLHMDSVDVYQLHMAIRRAGGGSGTSSGIDIDQVLGKNGIADTFDALRSQKLIRFSGITGVGDTDALHIAVNSGRFDVIQVYYNVLNPSAGVALPPGFASQDFRGLIGTAIERGMGVVAIRVLAGGVLGGPEARKGYATPSVGLEIVPGSGYESDLRRAERLLFLVGGDIPNLSQLGVRFALSHPSVSIAMVGFSSLRQIDEAAACSERGPLGGSTIESLWPLWASNFGT